VPAKKAQAHPPVKIEPLAKKHDRAAFSCGYEELDRYIKERASQEAKKQIAAPFVLLEGGDNSVIGYYTLSATSILLTDLPEETAKKLPRYPDVPASLLGRLAVDARYKRRGHGELLLMDALRRAFQATTDVASFAVVVDPKNKKSRSFYEHYGFLAFRDQKLRMYLPMKTIADLFA
jgi:ribosomal protein S18 acetylase RimI-like enzyme